MELRHLRYFVAIAEEGSFTQAAERRLHTAQPSLSRQIRDLETTLGVTLIRRAARGLSLTPAGQVFLDHARAILSQVDAAVDATRRAAIPTKRSFAVGFLTGQEIGWLPLVLDILREDLQRIELTIHSASSPELMQSLRTGALDVAFLRVDPDVRDIDLHSVDGGKAVRPAAGQPCPGAAQIGADTGPGGRKIHQLLGQLRADAATAD